MPLKDSLEAHQPFAESDATGRTSTFAPAYRSMPQSTVTAVLNYADVTAAVEWLQRAFGFTPRLRIGDHRVQVRAGDGDIVVARAPASELALAPQGQSLMVRVADVAGLTEQARACGARIVDGPTDQPYGERQVVLIDPGGHRWTFSQTLADIDPASWGGIAL